MDPLEARLQFIKQLHKLSGSETDAKNVVLFISKHLDLIDDLYSCILEELPRASLNSRMNILYCIEHICLSSINLENEQLQQRFLILKEWIARDFVKIVAMELGLTQETINEQTTGQPVDQNVTDNHRAGLYPEIEQETDGKELSIKRNESSSDRAVEDSGIDNSQTQSAQNLPCTINQSILNAPATVEVTQNLTHKGVVSEKDCAEIMNMIQRLKESCSADPYGLFDHERKSENDRILRRMNEDRERAKRKKETIWAIEYSEPNYEFNLMWSSLSGLTELDKERMQEENEMLINSFVP